MLPRDTEIIATVKMNRRRLLLFPSDVVERTGLHFFQSCHSPVEIKIKEKYCS